MTLQKALCAETQCGRVLYQRLRLLLPLFGLYHRNQTHPIRCLFRHRIYFIKCRYCVLISIGVNMSIRRSEALLSSPGTVYTTFYVRTRGFSYPVRYPTPDHSRFGELHYQASLNHPSMEPHVRLERTICSLQVSCCYQLS